MSGATTLSACNPPALVRASGNCSHHASCLHRTNCPSQLRAAPSLALTRSHSARMLVLSASPPSRPSVVSPLLALPPLAADLRRRSLATLPCYPPYYASLSMQSGPAKRPLCIDLAACSCRPPSSRSAHRAPPCSIGLTLTPESIRSLISLSTRCTICFFCSSYAYG